MSKHDERFAWNELQANLHNKILHNQDILINALTAKKWSFLYKFVRHAQAIKCMTYEKASELVRKERKKYGLNTKVYRMVAEDIVDWTRDFICHEPDKSKALTLFNIFIKIALEGQSHMTLTIAGLSNPLLPKPQQ